MTDGERLFYLALLAADNHAALQIIRRGEANGGQGNKAKGRLKAILVAFAVRAAAEGPS